MKVGDYVRIHTLSGHGGIAKLEKIDDICITDTGAVDKNNIIKSSSNIIDLIEVGDYVNGVKVDEIVYIGHGKLEDLEIAFRYKYAFDIDDVYTLKIEDIKSIVTRENFEAMEYKVGE